MSSKCRTVSQYGDIQYSFGNPDKVKVWRIRISHSSGYEAFYLEEYNVA
jgi:hypothetical protein